MVVKR
jgi:hypothetical protein